MKRKVANGDGASGEKRRGGAQRRKGRRHGKPDRKERVPIKLDWCPTGKWGAFSKLLMHSWLNFTYALAFVA